jgi:hypothetical protein
MVQVKPRLRLEQWNKKAEAKGMNLKQIRASVRPSCCAACAETTFFFDYSTDVPFRLATS